MEQVVQMEQLVQAAGGLDGDGVRGWGAIAAHCEENIPEHPCEAR